MSYTSQFCSPLDLGLARADTDSGVSFRSRDSRVLRQVFLQSILDGAEGARGFLGDHFPIFGVDIGLVFFEDGLNGCCIFRFGEARPGAPGCIYQVLGLGGERLGVELESRW